MDKKISIIVPVYNAANTLERCVRSLTGQTYTEIEIILVNDGSKDNSLELCNRLSAEDNRVCVVNQANGGVSSARNAGLDAATGEFVMFCDSDDWVSPNWCRVMLEHFVPGDLTVCQYQRWNGGELHADTSEIMVEVARRQDFLHYPMWMCSPWNKLFLRSIIEENNIRFSPELRMGEDFCFVLDYLCTVSGKVRFLNAQLYYYDVSAEDSLSKRVLPLEQCELLYQKITTSMDKLGATDLESQQTRDWLVAPHFEHLFREISGSEKVTCCEKLKSAKKMEESAAFRSCSLNTISWGNAVYLWFYKHKYLRIAMILRMIRDCLLPKAVRMRKNMRLHIRE